MIMKGDLQLGESEFVPIVNSKFDENEQSIFDLCFSDSFIANIEIFL